MSNATFIIWTYRYLYQQCYTRDIWWRSTINHILRELVLLDENWSLVTGGVLKRKWEGLRKAISFVFYKWHCVWRVPTFGTAFVQGPFLLCWSSLGPHFQWVGTHACTECHLSRHVYSYEETNLCLIDQKSFFSFLFEMVSIITVTASVLPFWPSVVSPMLMLRFRRLLSLLPILVAKCP